MFIYYIFFLQSLYKNVDKEISLTNTFIDLAIIGHPTINEEMHAMAKAKFGIATTSQKLKTILEMIYLAWYNEYFLKKIINLNKFIIQIDVKDTIQDVYEKINKSIPIGIDVLYQHCFTTRTSVTYQVFAMTILAESNKSFNNDHYNDLALLFSSCDDVISAEIPLMLKKISAIIAQHSKAEEFKSVKPEDGKKWLKANCLEAYALFEQFLQKHGHRALGEVSFLFICSKFL